MKTVKEASRLCKLSVPQIRAQIALGAIPTERVAGITVLADETVGLLSAQPWVPADLEVVVVKLVPAFAVDPNHDPLGRSWIGLRLDISPRDEEWPSQQRAAWGAWPLRRGRDDEVIGRILLPVVRGSVAPHLSGPIKGIAEEVIDYDGHRRVLFDVDPPTTDQYGQHWVSPRRGPLVDIGRTGAEGRILVEG